MTHAAGGEGPAKVRRSGPHYGIFIGNTRLSAYPVGSIKECSFDCDNLNRALAPLVARANLADRLAEALRTQDRLTIFSAEVLAEHAAISPAGEGGKQG